MNRSDLKAEQAPRAQKQAIEHLKLITLQQAFIAFLIASLVSGCFSVAPEGWRVGTVERISRGQPKGYAEFYVSDDTDGTWRSIWVRHSEDSSKPFALYQFEKFHGQLSDHLRIACKPGTNTFRVGYKSLVSVPIAEGKTTPVEVKLRKIQGPDSSSVIEMTFMLKEQVPSGALRP